MMLRIGTAQADITPELPVIMGGSFLKFACRDIHDLVMVGCDAIAVIKAHETLTPARMGYGRGRFESGGFNRRFIMSNGRSRMHGGGNLERLQPEREILP